MSSYSGEPPLWPEDAHEQLFRSPLILGGVVFIAAFLLFSNARRTEGVRYRDGYVGVALQPQAGGDFRATHATQANGVKPHTVTTTINHSLHSYLTLQGRPDLIRPADAAVLAVCLALFVLCWLESRSLGGTSRGPFSLLEAALIGACFQAMELVPAISFDYKLGLQAVPFLILAGRQSAGTRMNDRALLVIVGVLAVSFAYVSTPFAGPKTGALLINLALYTLLGALSFRGRPLQG